MELIELRDLAVARTFILQGLWLQRVVRPSGPMVRPILEWAFEIASGGYPLPPTGVVADIGNVAYGLDRGPTQKTATEIPDWPSTLTRSYEDHVLGKLYADWTFERASDAVRRYAGRDRAKGLSYVLRQVRDRAGLGGVELPPAVVRGLIGQPGDELLAEGYESLTRDGPMPLLVGQYEQLVSGFRRLAEVLGPEDMIALEQRTALADMGQYVAHRQILTVSARIEAMLPARPVCPLAGRKEVPTRVHDEDQYPVGGYTSIATRGSIESLLHSQLSYMEDENPPDLFDVKFVRDELFYYSRDENQFLRRRRTFVFALLPDLTAARFKDADLPAQRIVFVLASVLVLVRKLAEWLGDDALTFEVLFVRSAGDAAPGTANPLGHEMELMQLLLREPIERDAAIVRAVDTPEMLATECAIQSRVSQTHALLISTGPTAVEIDGGVRTEWVVDGNRPSLIDGHGRPAEVTAEDAFDHWVGTVETVLKLWV